MKTTTNIQNPAQGIDNMASKHATFISIIADASGSMTALHETVIKGLNDFVAEQATSDADAKITIVQFPPNNGETGIQTILPKSDVKKARAITDADYIIRGMTPLYDAIGAVVEEMDRRIAKRTLAGKEPESQVVVIFTDGGENASRRHTRDTIFSLIAERKAQGWVFVFLGANQDAFEEGGLVGFDAGNTRNFDASDEGMQDALLMTARSVRLFSALPPDARRLASDSIFSIDDAGDHGQGDEPDRADNDL